MTPKMAKCFVCCNDSPGQRQNTGEDIKLAKFAIRTVLKIGQETLKEELLSELELPKWWAPCGPCAHQISQCYIVYQQLTEIKQKFEAGRLELVEKFNDYHENEDENICPGSAVVKSGGDEDDKEFPPELPEENYEVKIEADDPESDEEPDYQPFDENFSDGDLSDSSSVTSSTQPPPRKRGNSSKPHGKEELVGTTTSEPAGLSPERDSPRLTANNPQRSPVPVAKEPSLDTSLLADLKKDPVTKKFTCPSCPYSNSRRYQITYHYEGIHIGLKCSVPGCTKTFRNQIYFKCHMDRHNGTPSYSCDRCDLKFYIDGDRRRHRQAVHEGGLQNRNFICDICGNGFSCGSSLTSHKAKVHSRLKKEKTKHVPKASKPKIKRYRPPVKIEADDPETDEDPDYQPFDENFSDGDSSDSSSVTSSTQSPPRERGNSSRPHGEEEQVGTTASEPAGLSPERAENPQRSSIPVAKETFPAALPLANLVKDPVTKKFTCPSCPFSHSRRYKITYHYEGVHIGLKCSVPGCTKSFRNQVYFKCHMDRHNGTPSYSCERCDLKFFVDSDRRRHRQAVHEGGLENRNFICEICGRGFSCGSSLTSHKAKVHRRQKKERKKPVPKAAKPKIKRYRPPELQKIYADRYMLRCSECPSRFQHPVNLNYHLFLKHGQGSELAKKEYLYRYRFRCEVKGCISKHPTQELLDIHVNKFHGENKDKLPEYFCQHCGKAWFKKYDLVRHERRHMKTGKKLKLEDSD